MNSNGGDAIKQLHKGPRGGVYTLDLNGRKRYIKNKDLIKRESGIKNTVLKPARNVKSRPNKRVRDRNKNKRL